jgi:hypothetical protein
MVRPGRMQSRPRRARSGDESYRYRAGHGPGRNCRSEGRSLQLRLGGCGLGRASQMSRWLTRGHDGAICRAMSPTPFPCRQGRRFSPMGASCPMACSPAGWEATASQHAARWFSTTIAMGRTRRYSSRCVLPGQMSPIGHGDVFWTPAGWRSTEATRSWSRHTAQGTSRQQDRASLGGYGPARRGAERTQQR